MLRRVIAGLVLVSMAIGVWLLWPVGEEPIPSSTTALAVEPSTTVTSSQATTVASAASTTTIATDDHIVETVEEAEAILRELWFGWFEGIYNQDEDRIREVVATEEQVQAAVDQFGVLTFEGEPARDQIRLSNTEILRSDSRCFVAHSDLDFLSTTGVETEGIHVFLWESDRWFFVSLWLHIDDLWSKDCDARLS